MIQQYSFWIYSQRKCIHFFFLSLFVYLFIERERENEQVVEGQREKERENPKQAVCYRCRAPFRA